MSHNYIKAVPNSEMVNPNPSRRNDGFAERFDHWSDEDVIARLAEEKFEQPRKLKDGSWVALYRLAYTWSVCCDITQHSPYAYRWCFKDEQEARYFLETMEEFDDIPVKRESLKGHRYNEEPRLYAFDQFGLSRW